MKKVEAPLPGITPPAAPHEDMAQPMGPLEEGDQALVDAVQAVPVGEHMARQDDGTITRLKKDGTYKQDIVLADTTTPDGSTTGVSTMINTVSRGGEDISASKSEWPADEHGGRTTDHVSGNDVETGTLQMEPDRAKAQAVKLEVAQTINQAAQRMAEAQVQDPAVAHDMALAEKPHRDEIVERNKEVAEAKEATTEVAKNYVNNVGNVGPMDITEAESNERGVRVAVAFSNNESLDKAGQAAEEVRQQQTAA